MFQIGSKIKRLPSEFGEIMRPVYEKAKGTNVNFYDFQYFLNLLYILGLFGTRCD
jgi:hypothetical protein